MPGGVKAAGQDQGVDVDGVEAEILARVIAGQLEKGVAGGPGRGVGVKKQGAHVKGQVAVVFGQGQVNVAQGGQDAADRERGRAAGAAGI